MNTRTMTWIASITLALTVLGTAVGLSPQTRPVTQPVMAKPASTFKIDSVHSTAIFHVQHLGAGRFYGRFNTINGSFTFGENGQPNLEMDVSIPIDSIDTNNEGLDGHLKSPDFFNAKEFPEMSFKSRGFKRISDKRFMMEGDLMLHGQRQTVRPSVEWIGSADMGRGYRCGLVATFTIKRSDFGIMYGVKEGAVGDEVEVTVSLEGVREGA